MPSSRRSTRGSSGRTFGEDNHGGTENDGYLFEYDYTKEYKFEYLGSNLDEYKIFDPKTHESQAATQIWQPVEDMIQTMNEAPDSTFVSDMAKYLDLGLFSRHIALEAFIGEDDGILGYAGLNNFYFYRFEDTTKSQFLVWDKDNTFAARRIPIMRNVNENVLSRRTLNLQQYRNRYLDTLLEAAQSIDEKESASEESEDEGKPNRGRVGSSGRSPVSSTRSVRSRRAIRSSRIRIRSSRRPTSACWSSRAIARLTCATR